MGKALSQVRKLQAQAKKAVSAVTRPKLPARIVAPARKLVRRLTGKS